ncbi:unnamed protein product [Phytophthora lilii]|uniref:Unnamed protein product n=1 Tax=Phytophthora lilii TaxID=2077276 RepID=A0A9W7D8H8_9STRA|nr:unnamed protein product [Phytophthora lilii]
METEGGAEQPMETPEAQQESQQLADEMGEAGGDVESGDEQSTALMTAAANGDIDAVRHLARDCGVDVNAIGNYGRTALMRAADEGHVDIVRYLADECGADVNATDEDQWTALMWAANDGHVEVVRYLAGERGADVNAAAFDGSTALMRAADDGHFDVVRYLARECGADVKAADDDGWTALMWAADGGHTGVIRYLAEECDADVNVRDGRERTALMKAAEGGHIDTVRYLALNSCVDVNAGDENKWTALLWAAEEGEINVVRCLIDECGADRNARADSGWNALMWAAAGGHLNIVRYLAGEREVDLNTTDNDGQTSLIVAAHSGHIDVVRYLAGEGGAEVNATDDRGRTALMRAAKGGHTEIVRFLAEECSADVNIKCKGGQSAIGIAADRGFQDIQRLLTQFVAIRKPKTFAFPTAKPTPDAPKKKSSSWHISPSEIELMDFVETGNVGGEFRAKWLDADAAVKLFLPDTSSHEMFEDEVHLWHQLRHPNVIKMYGACDASPLPLQFFVCEYASKGSLLEHVTSTPAEKQTVWAYLHQAALGLEYLHERGIVHGDLRCSNILIGSDGLAKLTNFGRSLSAKSNILDATSSSVGSMRWQSPEVLEGQPLSFTSDVYSLGMCILEAVTGKMPWDGWDTDSVKKYFKHDWAPERGSGNGAPNCPPGEVRKMIWHMCRKNPDSRTSLSSVVQELEQFAIQESSGASQPEHEPLSTFEDCNHDARKEMWMDVEMYMQECSNDHYREAFDELKNVHTRLHDSLHPPMLFDRFHTLVRDFRQAVTMSTEQARVLQLSATCATTFSILGFRRRLQSLWTALGESVEAAKERQTRWNKQHAEQIEIFVSESSKSYLLLEELKSPEERLAFLASLKAELELPFKYTPGQLELLKRAYKDIAGMLDEKDKLSGPLVPVWFIPWYELIVDKDDPLGQGGYGSVFRAKWLDSDVVVKRLGSPGDEFDNSSSVTADSLYESVSVTSATNSTTHAEMLATFQREVDIWFGFSHPHVVRLFGACHVGRPFFVCEYATNGTLVSYLRSHPDELWTKLHEAALGVQYLHARGVVHGDLKGNNIVIGSDRKAKVTDFGLSSITNEENEAKISGASQWVAPECFASEDAQPTYASDIYSLGMCIVEALRVADAGEDKSKVCLPWRGLDNFVVRGHVKQEKLPSRPSICSDEHWQLVKRMCVFKPEQRLKISTVVDALAELASSKRIQDEEIATPNDLESVPTAIVEAKELLLRLKSEDQPVESPALYYVYELMWDEFDNVHDQIKGQLSSASIVDFCSLIKHATMSTKNLQGMTMSLVILAQRTLQCYALRRRLDKYVDAQFLLPPGSKN